MKIDQSKNYNQFKFYRENRLTSSANIKSIAESIKVHGLICPIVVDRDFYIVDGQNRFEALKELKKPVTYVLNTKADKYSVIQANIQKSWALTDYINFYARDGFSDYQDLLSFYEQYRVDKITLPTFAKIFSKSLIVDKDIRLNKYKFDPSFGVELLTCLTLISQNFDSAFHSRFVITFKNVMINNPHFSIKRFLKKMSIKKLNLFSSTGDTYSSIVEVYNFKGKRGNIK